MAGHLPPDRAGDQRPLGRPGLWGTGADRGFEEAGHRVLHWECVGATNARQDPDGSTGFFLPGEEGYKDVRGSGLFPDIPGQSRDPIYNTTLPEN